MWNFGINYVWHEETLIMFRNYEIVSIRQKGIKRKIFGVNSVWQEHNGLCSEIMELIPFGKKKDKKKYFVRIQFYKTRT